MTRRPALTLAICALTSEVAGASTQTTIVPRPDLSRAAQVVEAVIAGTHAYQLRLARGAHTSGPCWDATRLSDTDLDALVSHQAGLFASNRLALRDWIAGRDAMRFDPRGDLYPLLAAQVPLDPGLPVNVFTTVVGRRSHARPEQVRSVASLYQLILEVERDGDVLQDAFAFLIGLGLPVYGGQIGLPGDDAAHASLAAELASASCAAPFATDAAAWTIAGRKVWNWGEKHLGIRNADTVAGEMASDPAVKAVLSQLRTAPPSRVAIVGDSFTMGNHWASPGSFTTIAAALVARAQVPLEMRHYAAGGLKAARAWQLFGREVAEWHPDVLLFEAEVPSEDDVAALRTWLAALHEIRTRVVMFDAIGDPSERDLAMRLRRLGAAREAGVRVVPVEARLAASADHARFLSMDGIHMTEPYHRLMALAWLEALRDTLTAAGPSR
jgi:hypothetical protein